jgi:hypothetical protein
MKISIIDSHELLNAGRLDCWYHLSPGNITLQLIRKCQQEGRAAIRPLGGQHGVARLSKPDRAKMYLAAPGEKSAAYLRPYDLFNYLPEAADNISVSRTTSLADLQLHRGQILQTCSGRNLGPSVLIDSYTAQFVVGPDMIRIDIDDEQARQYTFAFLNSVSGRNLLRREKTGSVIDHLDINDLQNLPVPFFGDHVSKISALIQRAFALREKARCKIQSVLSDCENSLPRIERTRRRCLGWTTDSTAISDRIDAAFYDPIVEQIRRELKKINGQPMRNFATVRKPAGRYKTRYVGEGFGRPLLSGAQLLQSTPINLQFMHPKVFKNVKDYELQRGWIGYPADGRAEEELGTPVIITNDRDKWLASGHVGRVIPDANVDVGWLFSALKTTHCQLQLKSRASGSVVDSTFPPDLEEVIVPPVGSIDGAEIRDAWENFGIARSLESEASTEIDKLLQTRTPTL